MSLFPDQKASLGLIASLEDRETTQAEMGSMAFSSLTSLLVHEALAQYAQAHPDEVAAVFGRADGQEEVLSYGLLHRCSNQLAHALQTRGVGPEVVVAIAIDRADSLLMLVSFWAVLKAGGAVLLLNPSSSYPRARRDAIIGEAGVKLLLTQRHLFSHLPAQVPHMLLSPEKLKTLFCEEPEDMPDVLVLPETLAYLVATSGTTAREPKVIQVEHRSLANLAAAQIAGFGIRREDRVLQFAAWTFDAVISEIVMASRGATLVMGGRQELRPGPSLIHFLSSHRVTVATLTPSVLTDPRLPRTDLAPLRLLICAGEVLPASVVSRYSRAGLQIFNAYGPAECGVCLTLGECSPDGKPPDAGFVLPGVELAILDEEMQPAPSGECGTLYAAGVMLSRGYTNAERTAERFVEMEARRWYNTGDLASQLPDGRIKVFGRVNADRQVKVTGGRRVQLEEVEQALMYHPDLHAALVASRGDQSQQKQLVAFLICKAALPAQSGEQDIPKEAVPQATWLREPQAHMLREFLFEQGLEPYMIPDTFLLVPFFPHTLHDKVDLSALLRLAAQTIKGSEPPQRGKEAPHAVSYARQASFASRYLLPHRQRTTKGENRDD